MANKDRGEVTLQVGGVTHVVRFTVNNLCNLENEMDMPITEIGAKIGSAKQVRLGLLRTILKHGLVQPMSETEVGDLIGAAGLPAVLNAIMAAITQAFPEAKVAEGNPK